MAPLKALGPRTRKRTTNEKDWSGQRDCLTGWLGVLTVEERGVAYRADAEAATFVSDLIAEGGALVSIQTKEAELHEFAGAKMFLQFCEEGWCEALFAQLQGRIESLAKAAQVGTLRAGERKLIHRAKLRRDGADAKRGVHG